MKRWSNNGKVVWSWCIYGGLLSGLDQDFDLCYGSLLRWHSLLSWSYRLWWFKDVRNGVRGFVCVISVRGLSSLDAWLRGSVGIFATSLGFTKCFCKSFHSLEAIFAAGGGFCRGGGFSQLMLFPCFWAPLDSQLPSFPFFWHSSWFWSSKNLCYIKIN